MYGSTVGVWCGEVMGSAGVGCSGLWVVSKYLRVARRGRLTKLGYMLQYSTAQHSTVRKQVAANKKAKRKGRGEAGTTGEG